jgi:hypothetical protein
MLEQVRPQKVGNRAAAVKGGFLIAEPARLLYGTAEPASPLRDVTPPALQLDGDRDVLHDVVADSRTGRIALHVLRRGTVLRDDVLILDQDYSVLGQITIPFRVGWGVTALGFCQPDQFITLHGFYSDRQLRSWAVGQPAVTEAEREVKRHEQVIQTLPYTGLIRIGDGYVNAKTLEPAPCPIALTWEQRSSSRYTTYVALSRDGGYAAVSRSRSMAEEGAKERRRLLGRASDG